MKAPLLAAAFLLWAAGTAPGPQLAPATPASANGHAPTPVAMMGVDEIRPGMTGRGQTVFAGDAREPFTAHIIGVLENVVGPGRDIILARLEGGPIADAGVIQGMSGSPVYVDGRLIGAVSYALGAFPKAPIAGITPIAEMIEDAALTSPRPTAAAPQIALPLTAEGVATALRAAHTRLFGAPLSPAASAQGLRPIGVPLVMSGLEPGVAAYLREALATTAFAPIAGGTVAADTTRSDDPFAPGDAIGVAIVTGDLTIGATGTVTHVDGDTVYGFGHPFLNLGPIDFPMTRVDVLTVLPSMMTSMKIASLGRTVGAITQDRSTTVAGRVGTDARVVPVNLSLSSERGLHRDLSFRIVHDPLLTPLYGFVAVLNSLAAYERQAGASTFAIRGTIDVDGQAPIALEDVVSGDGALVAGAAAVAGPLAALLANDLDKAHVTGIRLDVEARETTSTATIERAWIDAVRPKPGDTIDVRVELRHYRGTTETVTIPIEIPAYAQGRATLMISDGAALAAWEQRDGRAAAPGDLAGLVRALNRTPRSNRLYVRLLADLPGAVVKGEALNTLPPSVQSVLTDSRAGEAMPLRQTVLGASERRLDVSVRGSRELTFSIESGR